MIFKTEIGFGLCKLITYQLVEVLLKVGLLYMVSRENGYPQIGYPGSAWVPIFTVEMGIPL